MISFTRKSTNLHKHICNAFYAYKGRTIERFVLLIGYARSGSTMVGALLNAHPEIVVSNEAGGVGRKDEGDVLSRSGASDIIRLILNRDRRTRAVSYRDMASGYTFAVENQWQGKYSRLRVIGDKMSRLSNRGLYDQLGLFDSLRSQIRVPVHVLFICRNPYDMSSTQHLRRLRSQNFSVSKSLWQFDPADAEKSKLDQKVISEFLEVSAKLAEVLPYFQQRGELLSMKHEGLCGYSAFPGSPKPIQGAMVPRAGGGSLYGRQKVSLAAGLHF